MHNSYQISEAEWQVIQVLWHEESLPLKDIIDVVSPITGWNGNTIRTLLVRLVEKGAVAAEKQGRNYRYSALAGEEDCVREETRNFLNRIFDGSATKLFAALTGSGDISAKDLSEIRAMIDAMEGEGRP